MHTAMSLGNERGPSTDGTAAGMSLKTLRCVREARHKTPRAVRLHLHQAPRVGTPRSRETGGLSDGNILRLTEVMAHSFMNLLKTNELYTLHG